MVFGSDWRAEHAFLTSVFERHASGRVHRLFEPACGTGRLLFRFAKDGYQVAGNDLNAKAVDFCNRRLARHGLAPAAVVGDMCDFRLKRRVDAAFNTINSFRHIPSEALAEAHLRCVAAALRKGGLYALGLHLTPQSGRSVVEEECWAARRGALSVLSRMWVKQLDRKRRVERVGMTYDVYTPLRQFRLACGADFRTYTARQMAGLIGRVDAFELVATYDFAYDLDRPVVIGPQTEDVVYILRKR